MTFTSPRTDIGLLARMPRPSKGQVSIYSCASWTSWSLHHYLSLRDEVRSGGDRHGKRRIRMRSIRSIRLADDRLTNSLTFRRLVTINVMLIKLFRPLHDAVSMSGVGMHLFNDMERLVFWELVPVWTWSYLRIKICPLYSYIICKWWVWRVHMS